MEEEYQENSRIPLKIIPFLAATVSANLVPSASFRYKGNAKKALQTRVQNFQNKNCSGNKVRFRLQTWIRSLSPRNKPASCLLMQANCDSVEIYTTNFSGELILYYR